MLYEIVVGQKQASKRKPTNWEQGTNENGDKNNCPWKEPFFLPS